jgi:hypothetical protein
VIDVTREEIVAAAAADMQGQLTPVTDAATLTEQERRSVPDWWTELITAEPAEAVSSTVSRWNSDLTPPLLPRFLRVLTDRGIDIALVRVTSIHHTGLALLYSVQCPGEEDRYVCGLPPAATLPEVAAKLPASFQAFYSTIHSGMYFELNNPHAILKPDELITWHEWIFGDEIAFIDKPPRFIPSAETLYVVFNDNGGAMALVDIDPADPGVWATDVGMLDDRSNQFRSTWELLDHWISGWFTPLHMKDTLDTPG